MREIKRERGVRVREIKMEGGREREEWMDGWR